MLGAILLFSSCGKLQGTFSITDSSDRYLYVASGTCYGGGVTTSTGAAIVSKWNITTGEFVGVVADYTNLNASQPVGLADFNSNYIAASIESTGGRRIDLIPKSGGTIGLFSNNTTALSTNLRGLALTPDGGLLSVKVSAIERFSASGGRLTNGGNPYVNAPQGSCTTANTAMTWVTMGPNNYILYTHAAATPNNEFGVIIANGTINGTAADCLAAQAGPATTALPTGIIYHSTGKVIVTYGSTTAGSNYIYAYDLSTTTGAISGATASYTDVSIVNGPSAIVEDPVTRYVYVANALSTMNTIERFSFNSSTKLLSRVDATSFIPAGVYTRCISGMVVSSQ